MLGGRGRGLSFRKRTKRESLAGAKGVALFVIEIIIALFAAFVVVYCAGMRITVVDSSMERILSDGDEVLVNRFTYMIANPKAGDVVVFLPNGNEKSHYYIKRVVGTPGDTVQIDDGVLYVNGSMFDEKNVDSINNAGIAENEITLGDDEYFVLGDNRNSSEDSRYATIGNVNKEFITGKAWLKIRPLKEIKRIK